jgi:hypothetical protein
MTDVVAHPDIRYVVYPVHRDSTPTGAMPKFRHDPGCSHSEWGTGTHLGTPVLATTEQMRSLKACDTCLRSRGELTDAHPLPSKEGRTGKLCPTCTQVMPLTGVCDSCA